MSISKSKQRPKCKHEGCPHKIYKDMDVCFFHKPPREVCAVKGCGKLEVWKSGYCTSHVKACACGNRTNNRAAMCFDCRYPKSRGESDEKRNRGKSRESVVIHELKQMIRSYSRCLSTNRNNRELAARRLPELQSRLAELTK